MRADSPSDKRLQLGKVRRVDAVVGREHHVGDEITDLKDMETRQLAVSASGTPIFYETAAPRAARSW